MAQHDYVIDNSTGANVRTDINNVLLAISSNNSGSSAPSTNYASQFFANTSSSIMQLRNTANNAHINLFSLAGAPAFPLDGTINSINIGKGANSVAGNTVLGESALDASVSGGSNTAIGKSALTANTSGDSNTAVGEGSLSSTTTGRRNTAVGLQALRENTTADNNTAIGRIALILNTTGEDNTAIGSGALDANTTASNNTAVGKDALGANTTGFSCTAVGLNALDSNTTGGDNTAIGQNAGADNTSGGGNVFIGARAGLAASPSGSVTTGNDHFVLGDDNITQLFCADTSISSSDSRDKTDVTTFNIGLAWIEALRPVTYKWDKRSWYGTEAEPYGTPDGSKKKSKINIGFLAQEALEVEKAHGYGDSSDNMLICNLTEDGMRYGMKYERLVPILVNAIKELSAKVTALEAG